MHHHATVAGGPETCHTQVILTQLLTAYKWFGVFQGSKELVFKDLTTSDCSQIFLKIRSREDNILQIPLSYRH